MAKLFSSRISANSYTTSAAITEGRPVRQAAAQFNSELNSADGLGPGEVEDGIPA